MGIPGSEVERHEPPTAVPPARSVKR
jgi:hypothetical protein